MRKREMSIKSFILWIYVALFIVTNVVHADILLLRNKQRIRGEMSLVADDYIEFKRDLSAGENEWIKLSKKSVVAIVSDKGKLIYPRDKFDENALNYGKIRIRNENEKKTYLERKKTNKLAQLTNERQEKDRFKVAALVGGLGGIMVWAFLDGR